MKNIIRKLGVAIQNFQLTQENNQFKSEYYGLNPKGHVRYCHHLASVVRPLTFHILIYSSETTGPNETKLVFFTLHQIYYEYNHFM
jgi:hypothetical protein